MDWTGIGGIVAALAVGIWRGIDKYAERKKTREKGLDPNPDRCEKHEIRLAVIDERLDRMDARLSKIELKLGI